MTDEKYGPEKGEREVTGSFFKFEKPGDQIKGRYIDRELVRTEGQKDNFKYFFDVEGNVSTFFGSAVLNSRFIGVKIGQIVRVVFTGTEPSEKGKNDTKMFGVYIS